MAQDTIATGMAFYAGGEILGMAKLAFMARMAPAVADGSFYSVAFETQISSKLYPGVYRGAHFKAANEALDAAIKSDGVFAKSMEDLGISVPRSPSGSIEFKPPQNWVWHHDGQPGIMQLVPKYQHPDIPGGIFWEAMHPNGAGGWAPHRHRGRGVDDSCGPTASSR